MYRSAPYDVQSVGAQSHQPYSDVGASAIYGRGNGPGHSFRSSGVSQTAASASDDCGEAYISRTLYICKLPPDFTEAQINEVLAAYGDIRKITCYPSRQIAFAEFWDLRDAQKARNGLKDVQIGGRLVEIQYSKTRDDRSKEKNTGTLYVRPITTERNFRDPNTLQQYKDLFNRYGEVKKVNTNRKREAEKFIEYHDLRSAEAALEALNGMDFNGVKLEVQYANQSSKTINKEGMVSDGPYPAPPGGRGHHFRRESSMSGYAPVRGAAEALRGPSPVSGSVPGSSGYTPPLTSYWTGPPIKMHWSGTHGPRAMLAAAAAMATSTSSSLLTTNDKEVPQDSAKNRADSAVADTLPNSITMLRGQPSAGTTSVPSPGSTNVISLNPNDQQRALSSTSRVNSVPVHLLQQLSQGVLNVGGLVQHRQAMSNMNNPNAPPPNTGATHPNVVPY